MYNSESGTNQTKDIKSLYVVVEMNHTTMDGDTMDTSDDYFEPYERINRRKLSLEYILNDSSQQRPRRKTYPLESHSLPGFKEIIPEVKNNFKTPLPATSSVPLTTQNGVMCFNEEKQQDFQNSNFIDHTNLNEIDSLNQLKPIRILAYQVGLSSNPQKNWRYRDIKVLYYIIV